MLRVASTPELPELLGPGVDQAVALDEGAVSRFKVQGRWLYATPGLCREDLLDVVLEAGEAYMEEWLLAPAPFFRRGVYGLAAGEGIGLGAIDPLIKELAAEERLGGLALLSASYQPYIAFYQRGDDAEIAQQIEAMGRQLERAGRAGHRDLPRPERFVTHSSWRDAILRHGEWRGWGRLCDGELLAWR
jgi:hypothetical protein